MQFQEFTEEIRKEVQGRLHDCQVKVTSVRKVNDVTRQGVMIQKESGIPAPTIYLEELFELYAEGTLTLQDAADRIVQMYHKSLLPGPVCLDEIMEYANVKEHLRIKLLNKDRNRSMLTNLPHVDYLNLSAVFYFETSAFGVKDGCITVTDSMTEKWGVRADTLWEDAMKYGLCADPIVLYHMEEMLDRMQGLASKYAPDTTDVPSVRRQLQQIVEQKDAESGYPLIVVATNLSGRFGAWCMTSERFLEDCASVLGQNYYILPSSLHELLLIPEQNAMEAKNLLEMVVNVNATEVEPGDFLANSVYYYHAKEHRIEIVANQIDMPAAAV